MSLTCKIRWWEECECHKIRAGDCCGSSQGAQFAETLTAQTNHFLQRKHPLRVIFAFRSSDSKWNARSLATSTCICHRSKSRSFSICPYGCLRSGTFCWAKCNVQCVWNLHDLRGLPLGMQAFIEERSGASHCQSTSLKYSNSDYFPGQLVVTRLSHTNKPESIFSMRQIAEEQRVGIPSHKHRQGCKCWGMRIKQWFFGRRGNLIHARCQMS